MTSPLWLDSFSIKGKVIAISMITSAVVLVTCAMIVIFAEYTFQRHRLDSSARLLSDLLGYNAGAAIAFRDAEAGDEMLTSLAALPHVIEARIYTLDGVSFGQYTNKKSRHFNKLTAIDVSSDASKASDLAQGPVTEFVSSMHYMDLTALIEFEGEPQGVLAIRLDLVNLRERHLWTVVIVLASALFSLLIVYLLSRRLQRSVTDPLEELISVFRDVSSSKDYSRRVFSESSDEVVELAAEFNSMLEVVGHRDLEMKSLVQELETANEAKSAFLANMSHEIRTPLTGILGITSLLAQMPQNQKAREYHRTIEVSANALLQIINDILDLSRIEAGKFEAEMQYFDLTELTAYISNFFYPTAVEKSLAFDVIISPDTPLKLKGDSRRVAQVLINLIGNALKFTTDGSVSVKISPVQTTATTATILFEVEDTGIGIDILSHQAVFKDFSQVDDSTNRRYGGTGLGLAVSKNIVELLEGEIGLESEVKKGSKFWFRVPFQIQSQIEEAQSSTAVSIETEPADKLATGHQQYEARVLVADDSDINQFIMTEILKTFGIDSTVVDSGRAAVNAIKDQQFDLILMDIQMPDIGGVEAARIVRDWEKTTGIDKPTPIIAFSASAMVGDRERFLEAGMDDYLSKPIEIDNLIEILQKWLSHCSVPHKDLFGELKDVTKRVST